MKTLADNLNRLIGPGKKFASNEAAAAASGIGRSTIDRARRAEVGLRIDNLAELARACGLEPWELLHPNLNLPTLTGSPTSGPEWPLPGITAEEFGLIPADERDEVTALAKSKVNRYQVGHSKSPSPGEAA